jgi:thiol-disulfide isomerase/thioredoxin
MDTFTSKSELLGYVNKHRRVLVLFCASWCPFCREFFQIFDRNVKKHFFGEDFRVYVDSDNNPLWEDYSLDAVPSALLFVEGNEARRLDGKLGYGLSEKAFVDWLKKL